MRNTEFRPPIPVWLFVAIVCILIYPLIGPLPNVNVQASSITQRGSVVSATSGADMPFGSLAASGTVTISPSANGVLYIPVNGWGAGRTSNATGAWVTSADSGSHINVALYDGTCTKLTNGDGTSVTSTGVNQQAVFVFSTPPTLTGQGWLGMSSDNAGLTATTFFLSIMDAQGQMGGQLNTGLMAAASLVFRGGNPSVTVGVNTTLPTTCGTRTAITAGTNSFPAIPWR